VILKVELHWHGYGTMKDAIKENKGDKGNAVYVLADGEGHPLYIGKPKNAVGFLGRYSGNEGLIDSALYGTGKRVFVAKTDGKVTDDVERLLIFEEKGAGASLSNQRIPKTRPTLVVKHGGEIPNFRYLAL